jgi:hypothetical protein
MPRFIAFHPCPVSCWNKIYSVAAAEASPRGTPAKRRLTGSPLPALVNQALRGTRRQHQGAGAENIDFSGKCADRGRPGWFTKPNPDEDVADLRDPELARFNRFSKDGPHSEA